VQAKLSPGKIAYERTHRTMKTRCCGTWFGHQSSTSELKRPKPECSAWKLLLVGRNALRPPTNKLKALCLSCSEGAKRQTSMKRRGSYKTRHCTFEAGALLDWRRDPVNLITARMQVGSCNLPVGVLAVSGRRHCPGPRSCLGNLSLEPGLQWEAPPTTAPATKKPSTRSCLNILSASLHRSCCKAASLGCGPWWCAGNPSP
jgi:hypothetical protein